MAAIIWTIKAVEQVEQIGVFIEKDSPFQAAGLSNLLSKKRINCESMHESAR